MQTNRAFVLRHVGDLYLLVPARRNTITQSYLSLNEMGAWIWENAAGKELVDLIKAAVEKFHLSKDEESAVERFCGDLITQGLLEVQV